MPKNKAGQPAGPSEGTEQKKKPKPAWDRGDGSWDFVFRGGPADGQKHRLYPQNDGHKEVLIQGHLYVAPEVQDAKKPYMVAASAMKRTA